MNENQNEILKETGEVRNQSIIKKFFSFNGRVCRKNFLIRILILMVILLFVRNMEESLLLDLYYGNVDSIYLLYIIYIIQFIFSISSLSLHIRRWHDLDKSGFYILSHIFLIPILYCAFKKGTSGINKYGPEDI